MIAVLETVHWLAGMIVVAEGLNKLERTCPLARGITPCQRLVASCKALGWCLLVLGAGGAAATPILLILQVDPTHIPDILRMERPTLAEVSALAGFAILIIRTRLKEACTLDMKRRAGDLS